MMQMSATSFQKLSIKVKKQDDVAGTEDIEDAINSAESENDKSYYDDEYFNQNERQGDSSPGSLLTHK